jgi:hypothetical protein
MFIPSSPSNPPFLSPQSSIPDPFRDLVLPNLDDSDEDLETYSDDYIRPGIFDITTTPPPPPSPIPLHPDHRKGFSDSGTFSTIIDEYRGRAADETYAQAVDYWKDRLLQKRKLHTETMKELLTRHRKQLEQLQRENELDELTDDPGTVVEAVVDSEVPDVFHRKGRRNAKSEQSLGAAGQRRRQLINRHKREILQLNAQCASDIRGIEMEREADLERKRPGISEDLGGQGISPPPSPGSVVRFVLSARKGFE